MTDTDDLQQRFMAARERLSAARATLDQYASNQGQPVDTVPEEPAYVVNPAYDAAREEYDAANAEFVRLEAELKPIWAEQAGEAVE
jgi:hypothetical protein